jgi:hypothetical protein
MEAVSAIKGGIRVRKPEVQLQSITTPTAGSVDPQDSREPALAGKP